MIVVIISGILRWLQRKPRIVPEHRQLSTFKTIGHQSRSNQRQTSTASIFVNPGFTSAVEADSHADSFVAWKNCIPMHHTERSCDVQPCSDDHAPVKNVPIVAAATGYLPAIGLNYILFFPQLLCLPNLGHLLFNPNQLHHFGTNAQDNSSDSTPMISTSRYYLFTS